MTNSQKSSAHKSSSEIHIPQEIRKSIEEKGFHLYRWITPDEVKLSVERDFLKVMKYVGAPLGIIAVITGLLSMESTVTFLRAFGGTICIGTFFIFFYLLFLSLRRSALLSRSSFVVMTHSSISLNGEILNADETLSIQEKTQHVSEIFEEELFGESELSKKTSSLKSEIMQQIFSGYRLFLGEKNKGSSFFKNMGNSKDSEKAIILILALYTLYVVIMSFVYIFGVLFLWVLGKVFVWLTTRYLLLRGNDALRIHNSFEKIDTLSQEIKQRKTDLSTELKKAQENKWKDGLLLDINAHIKSLSSLGKSATINILELRKNIQRSKYSGMFEERVYNNWIKKQIATPLKSMKTLLEKNILRLDESITQTQTQNTKSEKREFRGNLRAQEKRLQKQRKDMQKFITLLEDMIYKLS